MGEFLLGNNQKIVNRQVATYLSVYEEAAWFKYKFNQATRFDMGNIMNYPAASYGVSNRQIRRQYRSKLRGIRPQ